jgi:hypothetical protein
MLVPGLPQPSAPLPLPPGAFEAQELPRLTNRGGNANACISFQDPESPHAAGAGASLVAGLLGSKEAGPVGAQASQLPWQANSGRPGQHAAISVPTTPRRKFRSPQGARARSRPRSMLPSSLEPSLLSLTVLSATAAGPNPRHTPPFMTHLFFWTKINPAQTHFLSLRVSKSGIFVENKNCHQYHSTSIRVQKSRGVV